MDGIGTRRNELVRMYTSQMRNYRNLEFNISDNKTLNAKISISVYIYVCNLMNHVTSSS